METTRQYTPLIRDAIKYNISAWIANGHHLAHLDDSYQDFHAPGVNYLCLTRTPGLTIKLYELPPTDHKPIVSPHTHCYEFDSVLLSGRLCNLKYHECDYSYYQPLQMYKRTFKSKLNGGNGFDTVASKCQLELSCGSWYDHKYNHYFTTVNDIHTLIVAEPSLLFVSQYEDVKNESAVYTETEAAPLLDGLYKKMTKEKAQEMLTKALSVI